jgi:tripartite-type tricarboxylate transporter receptor subunit TctC
MVHVPYKGTGAALTDVLAGQAPVLMGSLLPVTPHFPSGKLRGLAVTTAKRWYTLPEMPTLSETVPGYVVELWHGTMAPADTQPAVINALNAAINRAMESPEMKKNLEQQGIMPTGGTPARFGERISTDYNNWLKVVKAANIKEN